MNVEYRRGETNNAIATTKSGSVGELRTAGAEMDWRATATTGNREKQFGFPAELQFCRLFTYRSACLAA